MKKILMILFLFVAVSSAQVYDGVPQPETWRFVNGVNDQSQAFFAGFVKAPVLDDFGFVGGYQYRYSQEDYNMQVWTYKSFDLYKDYSLWNLFIGRYHKGDKYSGQYSLTVTDWRYQLNFTINNLYQDGFFENESYQFSAGMKVWNFILLPGYDFTNDQMFFNARLYLQKKAWFQAKYNFKTESYIVMLYVHFNELF